MPTAKEVFQVLFFSERIEQEVSGYAMTTMTAQNTLLGGFPYKYVFSPDLLQKCDLIVGQDHILIDFRAVSDKSIQLYARYLIPIEILISFLYFFNNHNIFFLFLCLLYAFFMVVGVVFMTMTQVNGGSGSYIVSKEWITKFDTTGDFILEYTVPPGEPYVLSQYLAMHNIKIPQVLSGSTAWIGTEYPWPCIKNNFKIRVVKDFILRQPISYVFIFFAIGMIWLIVHRTHIQVQDLIYYLKAHYFI